MNTALANAWMGKLNDLNELLGHIETAPALFKPEFVQQTKDEYDNALKWFHFWAEGAS